MSMRAVVRTTVVAGVVVAVAMAGAGPAGAKGPTGVAIGVPGGVPVELSAGEGGDGDLVYDLSEDLGLWELTGDGLALLPEPPTEHLGPPLHVTWTMYNAVPANPDYAPEVVQVLYPHAAGGALVHTAAGQRYFSSSTTRGGWFRAPERLAADLEAMGIGSEVVVPAPDPAAAAPAASRSAVADGSGGWSGVATVATAAVLAAAVVAATMRRRAGRDAPAAVG